MIDKPKNSNSIEIKELPEKISCFDFYRVSIPWLKSLIWPLFFLLLIIVLRSQVSIVLERVNYLLEEATSLQYKEYGLGMDNLDSMSSVIEARKAFNELSTEAILLLINPVSAPNLSAFQRGHYITGCPSTKQEYLESIPGLEELYNKNFITLRESENNNCPKIYVLWWTEKAIKSYEVFMGVLANEAIQVLQNH